MEKWDTDRNRLSRRRLGNGSSLELHNTMTLSYLGLQLNWMNIHELLPRLRLPVYVMWVTAHVSSGDFIIFSALRLTWQCRTGLLDRYLFVPVSVQVYRMVCPSPRLLVCPSIGAISANETLPWPMHVSFIKSIKLLGLSLTATILTSNNMSCIAYFILLVTNYKLCAKIDLSLKPTNEMTYYNSLPFVPL